MKRLIAVALTAGVLGLAPSPQPVDAQQTGESDLKRCMREAVDSCDEDFAGNTEYMVAIRGWCYIIRTAICKVE